MTLVKKRILTMDPNTSGDLLRELAEDSDLAIKARVGRHPNTPEDALYKLSQENSEIIRYWVAHNLNSSSKILVMLLEYEKNLRKLDNDIIRVLYAHKNLPHIAKIIIETLFGKWVL